MTTMWRIAWHSGFGGSGTAETDNPTVFIRELRNTFGHLDSLEVFGAYKIK